MRTQNIEIVTNIWSIVAVLTAIISFTVKFTSLRDRFEYRISTLETELKESKVDICTLKDKTNNNDVVIMEIRTKLASIESMLLEMRKK